MTCMETICSKCGGKYLRGVFDGGCPKCSMRNTRSWELKRIDAGIVAKKRSKERPRKI